MKSENPSQKLAITDRVKESFGCELCRQDQRELTDLVAKDSEGMKREESENSFCGT